MISQFMGSSYGVVWTIPEILSLPLPAHVLALSLFPVIGLWPILFALFPLPLPVLILFDVILMLFIYFLISNFI